jgi:hypothetical protein
MMSIKLDWEKLCAVHKHLLELPTLTDETKIIIIMVMSDYKQKKSVVKFKDFLRFLWSLSEDPRLNVVTLVAQDEEGRILYRHKTMTAGGEEVPIGGNENVVVHWNALTQSEKDTYIRLIVSQINGHER